MRNRLDCRTAALVFVLGLALASTQTAGAATARLPGFSVQTKLTGLGTVTALAFAPDGTLFTTRKTGNIYVIPPGQTTAKVFGSVAVYTNSECGLLGIALDPNYPGYGQGGFVYVFATVGGSEQRIIRFKDTDGTGVERTDLVTGLPTLGQNHDGGCLKIGPDGKLYCAIGDGGSGSSKSQDRTNLFGKVLRFNLDGSIPDDNPYFGHATYRPEIYAHGFRNPFRLSIRPLEAPGEFQLWVYDVGSSGSARREEVNLVLPGKNYGWPNVEGVAGNASYVDPVHAYNAEGNCIAGGVHYQGSYYPEAYRGNLFYLDYGSNKVFRMRLNGDVKVSNEIFIDGEGGLIDLVEGPDEAIWFSNGGGMVFRIEYTDPGNLKPTASFTATPTNGTLPLEVKFNAGASTDPDGSIARFDWNFGDGVTLDDGGAAPSHTYTTAGTFTSRVTVTDDEGATGTTTRTITIREPVNQPPVARILTPADGASYDAGAVVEISGEANDPEDGPLAGTSLSWDVILHHNEHTHPWREGVVGAAGSFDVPASGLEENWSFEIKLTARDSKGSTHVVSRTVRLNYVPLELKSEPSGRRVTADGVSYTAPAVYQVVRGAQVDLGAPTPQDVSPHEAWQFARWSDGGAASHTVVGSALGSITASFEPVAGFAFIRGDSTRDVKIDISDAVFTLDALFTGGVLWKCADAADANDDGTVDISDPVATLLWLFQAGTALPAPSAQAGFDPTEDGLRCEGHGGA